MFKLHLDFYVVHIVECFVFSSKESWRVVRSYCKRRSLAFPISRLHTLCKGKLLSFYIFECLTLDQVCHKLNFELLMNEMMLSVLSVLKRSCARSERTSTSDPASSRSTPSQQSGQLTPTTSTWPTTAPTMTSVRRLVTPWCWGRACIALEAAWSLTGVQWVASRSCGGWARL